MKKRKLKKLVMMGISSGLVLASQSASGALPSEQSGLDPDQLLAAHSWTSRKGSSAIDSRETEGHNGTGAKNGSAVNMHIPPLTEEEFAQQLSIEGRRLFNTMNTEGKQLAIRLSKQYSDKTQAVKHAIRQMAMEDADKSEKRN